MNASLTSILLLGVGLVAPIGAANASYVITRFDAPGAITTDVWDISDSGQLVGTGYTDDWSFGYVYKAGALQKLIGPAGAAYSSALGISESGAVVGGWGDPNRPVLSYSDIIDPVTGLQTTFYQPGQRGYVFENGTYTSIDVPFAGAIQTSPRAISPDGRYISGTYDSASGFGGFVLDRTTSTYVDVGYSGTSIPQGINSAGQMVGNDQNTGYVRDLATGATTHFSFSGFDKVAPRAINDHGQIAGWLTNGVEQLAWIGTPDGYQTIGVSGATYTIGEGINNHGQVAGFYGQEDGAEHGFIATPAIDPVSTTAGAYTFSTAVIADTPIFIDPLVAVGYDYKIGAGNPLFKTVSLPIGIGDNKFIISVGGQSFEVLGSEIFDFTAHGFANGVAEFTVTGIEPSSQLDPNDASAFVTRLTFAGSGMFTGSQTALTADYTAPVPEPSTWALMLGGIATLGFAKQRRRAAPPH